MYPSKASTWASVEAFQVGAQGKAQRVEYFGSQVNAISETRCFEYNQLAFDIGILLVDLEIGRPLIAGLRQ